AKVAVHRGHISELARECELHDHDEAAETGEHTVPEPCLGYVRHGLSPPEAAPAELCEREAARSPSRCCDSRAGRTRHRCRRRAVSAGRSEDRAACTLPGTRRSRRAPVADTALRDAGSTE